MKNFIKKNRRLVLELADLAESALDVADNEKAVKLCLAAESICNEKKVGAILLGVVERCRIGDPMNAARHLKLVPMFYDHI